MVKEGTRYIDVETASDTSSEGPDSPSNHEMEVSELSDNDGEPDDHQGQDTDSERDVASELGERLDPRVVHIDDTQEPPRNETAGFQSRQRLLRNYGPNAYVLRIVNMDELGSGEFERATMKVCPSCGYRFDGNVPEPDTRFYHDLERAISVARQQIAALPETIDLPEADVVDDEEDD